MHSQLEIQRPGSLCNFQEVSGLIIGTIRGLGKFYADGKEIFEIWVLKNKSQGLPFVEGSRVPIALILNGQQFEAGLRSTKNCEYVWICPDLVNDGGKPQKLAHVLNDNGFQKNQRVGLGINGRTVNLVKVS